jgi:DNA-binding transcriptional ArsR family regulator
MKEGPDISIVAALIGNPACANMLMALLSGPALTATELAQEAGLSPSTVSGHLDSLRKACLVAVERQGRHRYFRLADPDVAAALEGLMPVATRAGHLRVRTGPRDPQLRRARTCYDHLAGDLAVKMFDRFIERRLLARRDDQLRITREGRSFFSCAGIDVDALDSGRRPLCRPCLDWSERRSHLGGTLGAAILDHVVARRWAVRDAKSRVVRFSAAGEQKMADWFSR